jgi:2-oxo-3-hexenedioate decarboxylase
VIDPRALAQELIDARNTGATVPMPSSRDAAFDLPAAYATEAEIARLRRAAGRTTVGRKVGYANKALWRALKLETILWAHMYDDTVHDAPADGSVITLPKMLSGKIEPEIVFKLAKPLGGGADAAAVLDAAEWIALGFELIDRPFPPEWQLQPVDFVASFGLHAGLIVGARRPVTPAIIDQLPSFKVTLLKNGAIVDEGGGKNVLRSPALCLAELASALARQAGAVPLAAGEIISTGTMTTAQPVAAGDTWSATLEGLDIPDLTARF